MLMTKPLHGKCRIYVVKKARFKGFKTECLLKKKKKDVHFLKKVCPQTRMRRGKRQRRDVAG